MPNKIYGFLHQNRTWYRAMVKFTDETKTVLHLVDRDGVHNFDHHMHNLREISSSDIEAIPAGQVKIFIHAVQRFGMRYPAFQRHFEGTIKNAEVTAIFSLLERKEDIVHESYAGDFIYEVNATPMSFRDLLLENGLTFARRVDGSLNRGIFERRAFIFMPNNILTQLSLQSVRSRTNPRSSNGLISPEQRFSIRHEILGHGGVNIFSCILD